MYPSFDDCKEDTVYEHKEPVIKVKLILRFPRGYLIDPHSTYSSKGYSEKIPVQHDGAMNEYMVEYFLRDPNISPDNYPIFSMYWDIP